MNMKFEDGEVSVARKTFDTDLWVGQSHLLDDWLALYYDGDR